MSDRRCFIIIVAAFVAAAIVLSAFHYLTHP